MGSSLRFCGITLPLEFGITGMHHNTQTIKWFLNITEFFVRFFVCGAGIKHKPICTLGKWRLHSYFPNPSLVEFVWDGNLVNITNVIKFVVIAYLNQQEPAHGKNPTECNTIDEVLHRKSNIT